MILSLETKFQYRKKKNVPMFQNDGENSVFPSYVCSLLFQTGISSYYVIIQLDIVGYSMKYIYIYKLWVWWALEQYLAESIIGNFIAYINSSFQIEICRTRNGYEWTLTCIARRTFWISQSSFSKVSSCAANARVASEFFCARAAVFTYWRQ